MKDPTNREMKNMDRICRTMLNAAITLASKNKMRQGELMAGMFSSALAYALTALSPSDVRIWLVETWIPEALKVINSAIETSTHKG